MAKKDYTNWDRKELIKEIDQLCKRKKYGLVWEDKPENVVVQCKTELPVLGEVKSKEIITDPDKPINLLIEGDNYHALSVLNYTHKGKIDAIYADPPYNTGAKNWVYNNDYVDANDAFRHSKWLSFMQNRLKLAKSLLKPEGVIVVTIDDYEASTLKLLMDDIFGEVNYLGTVVIKNNPQGRSSVSGFQISHEYALFYGRSAKAKIGRLPRTQEQIARYNEKDEIGPFEWRNFRAQYSTESPKMKYPIFVRKDSSDFRIPKIEWNKEKGSYDLLEKPKAFEQISLPVDSKGRERTWKWAIETVELVKSTEMGVRLDKDKNPSVFYKGRMANEWMLPYTIWDKSDYSASSMGTNLLISLLGEKKFDYPKSLHAVIDCLRVLTSKKDATFLDFFAGSGTTGHAVFELNKKDSGNRKFILCTNNENGIANEVCYPRIEKVINGYKFIGQDKTIIFEQNLNEKVLMDINIVLDDLEKAKESNKQSYDKLEVKIEDNSLRLYGIKKTNGKKQGVGGNLKYFKTSFVPADPTDKNKIALTKKATEMLCVKEDTFENIKSNEQYVIYGNKKRYTGIIYDHQAIDVFKKEISKIDGKFSVYVFSLGDDTFDEEFEDMKSKVKLSPIPEAILRVYRRIFK
ncbi:MAG: site-specific DNA-methyltransferase [Patescibacteria group bacterium]